MRINTHSKATLLTILTALSLALTNCSKKSGKESNDNGTVTDGTTGGDTESQPLEPTATATVSAATGQLQLAPMVTILPAKGTSSASLTGEMKEIAFALDESNEHTLRLRVNNEAFEAIDQAGSIMCMLAQTKFWEQANAGVYQAMIDESLCERESGGGNNGGGGGQDQGQQNQQQGATKLTLTYVNATREEGKPLISEFRVAGSGEDEAGTFYHVKLIVAAPPSDTNPAGIFHMNFTQHSASGDVGQSGFIRARRTTNTEFLIEIGMIGSDKGDGERNMQGIAQLTKADNGDFTGAVVSAMSDSSSHGSFSADFKVRFDADYLNVSGVSKSSFGSMEHENVLDGCYDRNKYKTAIYRYDLADSDGETVVLNSGFPAEYEKGGDIYNAHASYWGLWIDGGMSPETGDTIYRVEWGDNGEKTRTPYTVFAAPGKLIKLTKDVVTLSELKGVDMQYWNNGSNYLVQWNGSELAITAEVTYGDNGMEETPASGSVEIPQWGLNLWVNSLNASIQIPYGTEITGNTEIAYHSETVVSGTDDLPDESLVCFSNCPVMAPTAEAFERNQDYSNPGPMVSALYKTSSVTWGDQSYDVNQTQDISTALGTYTFDATNQVLMENNVAFALPLDLPTSEEEANQLNGVWSGALIPLSAWQDISNKSIDPWAAQQELDVYYRWTSGPQSWSKYQALKDEDENFVSFDMPLEFNYVLTAEDEFDGITDSNIVGKSYRLNYGGPGQLWGIPWKYNKDVGHEMPLFSLKAGTKVGNYYVYPLDGEQRMAQTSASNCASLSLDDMPSLPTVEEEIIDVGALGDIDSPTRYIGGVATGN